MGFGSLIYGFKEAEFGHPFVVFGVIGIIGSALAYFGS